ncbi:sensor histidine kinase [Treponema primitia]|uniref:sensor histidine kinase n=1 Tax=Treponema primitia TaxID=88058 RepID=UPI00025550A5|nr:sensor histidine kinase [Treponema primitia]
MKTEQIQFKFHPRVFNSLGADLVTDDIVAIIELVKNSYDAGAAEVIISFVKEKTGEIYLEIMDNGKGMTKSIIETVWFTIATPYKEKNNSIKIKTMERKVSGEKGLGRLSTARLGSILEMYTKSDDETCWKVTLDWNKIADSQDESTMGGSIEKSVFPFKKYESGTILRIKNLYKDWNDEDTLTEMIEELKNNLSRFVSPFNKIEKTGAFKISLKTPLSETDIKIKSPEYLNSPIYLIKGHVENDGTVKYEYKYNDGTKRKTKKGIIAKPEIIPESSAKSQDDKNVSSKAKEVVFCGSFEFEFRVWDVDSESTELFTNRFDIKKKDLRNTISYHKGISVYRDGILVLPKTDTARDWLGLDLRRISRVGERISNRQIIGYVSITNENNPAIIDSSNREGFKDNKELRVFKKYLNKIVKKMEDYRSDSRTEGGHTEPPFSDILNRIFPGDLKDKVEAIIKNKGNYDDILNAIREYETDVDKAKEDLSKRAYYYSRMATIGTLSSFLIHEIRGRTGDITDLHNDLRKQEKNEIIKWSIIKDSLPPAENAVTSLESLADRFSPLAIKRINKAKNICDPVNELETIIKLFKQDLGKNGIMVKHNNISAILSVFPGEMSSIFFNLFSNAIYWLNNADKNNKVIEIQFNLSSDKTRLNIRFHDSGPGIEDGMEEKIFWPGITNRTDGFGMGLTVASELVSQYNGKMTLIKPGKFDGATFKFDLPIRSK